MLTFVINKRSIHLQTEGPQVEQLCGAWKMYGSAMRAATDEEIAKFKLCGTCEKAARKRDDAPPLPFKPLLTEDDRELILEALGHYADTREPREAIVAVMDKFVRD